MRAMRRVVSPEGDALCAPRVRVLPARENNAALPALPGRQVVVQSGGSFSLAHWPAGAIHAPCTAHANPQIPPPCTAPKSRHSLEPLIKCLESLENIHPILDAQERTLRGRFGLRPAFKEDAGGGEDCLKTLGGDEPGLFEIDVVGGGHAIAPCVNRASLDNEGAIDLGLRHEMRLALLCWFGCLIDCRYNPLFAGSIPHTQTRHSGAQGDL